MNVATGDQMAKKLVFSDPVFYFYFFLFFIYFIYFFLILFYNQFPLSNIANMKADLKELCVISSLKGFWMQVIS